MNPFKFDNREQLNSQENLRERLRSLKKDIRGHIYDVLHADSDEYEKIIGIYDLEVKQLRRENKKILKSKNAELKKFKDDSAIQHHNALSKCNNAYSRLNYSIKQSTQLLKESVVPVIDEFKRFVVTCDQEEDKLFVERLEFMEGFTGDELEMAEDFVQQQLQKIEEKYQKQVKELDLPEEMLDILAQSEEVSKNVHYNYEKEYNEIASLFKSCSSKEPSGKEPSIKEPFSKEPSIKEPSIKEPSIKEPSSNEPFSKEPSSQLFIDETYSQEIPTTEIEQIDFEIPNSADQNIESFQFDVNVNSGEEPNESFKFNFDYEADKSEDFQFNF